MVSRDVRKTDRLRRRHTEPSLGRHIFCKDNFEAWCFERLPCSGIAVRRLRLITCVSVGNRGIRPKDDSSPWTQSSKRIYLAPGCPKGQTGEVVAVVTLGRASRGRTDGSNERAQSIKGFPFKLSGANDSARTKLVIHCATHVINVLNKS